jgi:MYXO-CTERM domain-containing protein
VIAVRTADLKGLPQRVLTIDVDQNVKGGLPKHVVVWSPSGTSCDLMPMRNEDIGLLLTLSPDGRWVATRSSLATPGRLAVTGGAPRGGGIKVVVGLAFLAVVLIWALSRRRRGVRPELPGGPRP